MRKNLILIIILTIGTLLRFYHLGQVPIGLHRDEAFLGYNAYSILKTGKDMTGNFLPLHLESFIYSPAGYSYFALPFIKFFDLSAFSIRFPSALFGTLTILLTYFFARQLLKNKTLALMSAGLLAINPWHINLSRTATENILVVFFITLGTLFFILWTRKNSSLLLISSFLSFSLTLLIYQMPRAFLPLFIPFLIFILLKIKAKNKKLLLALGIFLITIIMPLMFILSSKDLSLRIRTVSVFATSETQLIIDESIREDGVLKVPSIIVRAYHNKLIGYFSQILQNYFVHFTFNFLFTDEGFPTRYRITNSGLLYLFELPLLIYGIWSLLQKRKKEGILLMGWVILAPVGSALTFDDIPNLQRTLIMLPALSIISASGFYELILILKRKKRFLKVGIIFISVIVFYTFSSYLHEYYVHQLVHQPWYRHEGYKELVQKVNALLPSYRKAIITDRESAPAIFFLFYSKYDPHSFQEETKNSTLRDFDRVGFGRYEFSQEECPLKKAEEQNNPVAEKDVLYVNFGGCKLPEYLGHEIDQVRRADGSTVFRIIKSK